MKQLLLACSLLFLAACQEQPLVSTQAQGSSEKVLSQKEPSAIKEETTPTSGEESFSIQQQGIVPKRIEIPAINVDAKITSERLTEKNEMEVPSNAEQVGWFEPGTKPGNSGNAILAGHVDDKNGPAVFFDLKDLSAGDQIYVTDEDGKKLTFEVNKVVAYPKDDAPLREIFGPSNNQNLNLLTCTGTFDHSIQDHEERLVVYTSLVNS